MKLLISIVLLSGAYLAIAAPGDARPQVTLGNGEKNWIIAEGATREGATFTFSEVQVDEDAWLVLHEFKDGKPAGDYYVGATFMSAGNNKNVSVTADSVPAVGDKFIVMLHGDVNKNQEFDFVFVDEINVLDKAVFEGMKMIAHQIEAP